MTLLRLEKVRHRFGGVEALAGAELSLDPGEIHGLLGENGAGKTTLLNVLGGMLRPDAGTILLEGRPIVLGGPRDAWRHGIGLVHQHFTLVPALTALENLALGGRPLRGGVRLHLGRIEARAQALARETGLTLPWGATVRSMGVGDRQRLEILRVLLRDPRIIVLDEPTAVLAPDEVHALFRLLRSLAEGGRSVVLVAHKLDEVLPLCHRVTVLRRGETVLTSPRPLIDRDRIVRAMVGGARGVEDEVSRPVRPGGNAASTEVIATLRDVHRSPQGAGSGVRGVTLEIRRGEIVGVAGVDGNGQRELARILARRLVPERGEARLPEGIGFIPEDRTVEGLIPDFDLVENVALARSRAAARAGAHLVPWKVIEEEAREIVHRYDIRAPGARARARTLSGGNQQRLVVGRELARGTELLVAENPTRGLDFTGERFVHERLLALRGASSAPAVVLLSSDLDEVLALSDRVLVIIQGRIVEVPSSQRSREAVGALMVGAHADT